MTPRRLTSAAVVAAAALALCEAAGGAGTPTPLSAKLVAKGTLYRLAITLAVPATGLNEVALNLPAGHTYTITKSPHCKLADPVTIDCKPVNLNNAATRNALLYMIAHPKLPASPPPPVYVTVEGPKNSYEAKVPIVGG